MDYTPRLKDRAYYENRYDDLIISQCRMTEKTHASVLERTLNDKESPYSPEQIKAQWRAIKELTLYFRKWSLAEKRDKRIVEWMNEDKKADEFYLRTHVNAPYCIYCNKEMPLFLKDMEGGYTNKKLRILFIFKCEPCKYVRWSWNDGEEYKIKKSQCEKCGSEDLESKLERWEKFDTFREICKVCSHIKEDRWEHYVGRTKESDPDYEKDRERFVLTQQWLWEYQDGCRRIKEMEQLFADIDARKSWKSADGTKPQETRGANEKPISKKILDVADMKTLVTKGLPKARYKDVSFWSPSINKKDVSIELTLFWKYLEKDEFIACMGKILDNTNWIVSGQSVQMRLWILNCRLVGS